MSVDSGPYNAHDYPPDAALFQHLTADIPQTGNQNTAQSHVKTESDEATVDATSSQGRLPHELLSTIIERDSRVQLTSFSTFCDYVDLVARGPKDGTYHPFSVLQNLDILFPELLEWQEKQLPAYFTRLFKAIQDHRSGTWLERLTLNDAAVQHLTKLSVEELQKSGGLNINEVAVAFKENVKENLDGMTELDLVTYLKFLKFLKTVRRLSFSNVNITCNVPGRKLEEALHVQSVEQIVFYRCYWLKIRGHEIGDKLASALPNIRGIVFDSIGCNNIDMFDYIKYYESKLLSVCLVWSHGRGEKKWWNALTHLKWELVRNTLDACRQLRKVTIALAYNHFNYRHWDFLSSSITVLEIDDCDAKAYTVILGMLQTRGVLPNLRELRLTTLPEQHVHEASQGTMNQIGLVAKVLPNSPDVWVDGVKYGSNEWPI